jgi:hypothetical protein
MSAPEYVQAGLQSKKKDRPPELDIPAQQQFPASERDRGDERRDITSNNTERVRAIVLIDTSSVGGI